MRADPRRRIAGVLQLIDARHPELPQDAAAFEWLMRTHLPIAVVATKIDKLNRADQSKAVKALEEKYGVTVLARIGNEWRRTRRDLEDSAPVDGKLESDFRL